MDSLQRAKKANLLSQATNILGKRPQRGFDVSRDGDNKFDTDEDNSGARRLRRKVQETSMSFPRLHEFPLLSTDGHQEPVTRFEQRQHEQQVVDQSRGGRKGTTGNQPQQFATRAMTRSRSQQMMLKNRPDNHWGTSPKEHQSIAGPTRTSDHKAGVYAAHTNSGYNGFALNPKASSARDYTSPSDTGELVEGPVEMMPSLRPPLRRDYTRNIVPNSGTRDLHSCKHCSSSFTRQQNLKRHMSRAHHESRVRTDVSSSSSSKKPSKKENNEGTSAKDISFQQYFALPSSRTASAPETQVKTTFMSSMSPGANPNTDALHHLNHATEQQQVYQPNLSLLQQHLLQLHQLQPIKTQPTTLKSILRDGFPTKLAHPGVLSPHQLQHPHAEVNMAQQLAFQQQQQEQQRQTRQPLVQGSDLPSNIDQWVQDPDKWTIDTDRLFDFPSWNDIESTDKHDDGARRVETDLPDMSANFSPIGHYTISQDNTEGEEARKALLLASFGRRCAQNREVHEFEKQKTLRKGHI